MIALLAPLVLAQSGPVTIEVSGPADRCGLVIAGRSIAYVGQAELEKALAILPKGSDIRVVADDTVPYRCIGGVIYVLQRLGHTRIEVPAGIVSE